METWDLPDELRDLERALMARPRPGLPPVVGQHVIAAVRSELRRDRVRSRFAFAMAVAAAMLAWTNLSLSATHATDYALPAAGRATAVDAAARQLREAVPELPAEDAWRQAVLLQGGATLVPRPAPPAPEHVMARIKALNETLTQGE